MRNQEADAEWRELGCKSGRKAFECEFSRGVDADPWRRYPEGCGGDVDDDAVAVGAHVWDDSLHGADCAEDVGLVLVADEIRGSICEDAADGEAGIVDQDIDWAVLVDDG